MSADDKKTNVPADDGIAELLDAFGGYDENKGDDDPIIVEEAAAEDSAEDSVIVLSEIPTEDTVVVSEETIPDEVALTGEITPAGEDEIISIPETAPDADVESEMPAVDEPGASAPSVKADDSKKKKKDKKKDKKKKDAEETPAEEKQEKFNKSDKSENVGEDKKDKKKDGSDKKDNAHGKDKKDKKDKAKKDEKTPPEAEKPAQDDAEAKPVSPVRLVAVLTVICAAVALLLATVNHFTEAKIAGNNAAAMLSSVRDIFDDSVEARLVEAPAESEISSLYLVTKNGNVCGYAASVSPTGFGGAVNLMVGVDSAGEIAGVRVVSHSETPGLGSKVGGDDFLSRFAGKSGEVKVDVISGASISSNAVMSGVNSVTSASVDLEALAADRGMSVVPYDANETVQTTTPVTEAPVVTEAPATEAVTAAPVTDKVVGAPDVTKGDSPVQNIVNPADDPDSKVHAEYEQVTAEYETLTTEPESSEPVTAAP